ncbi:MAG: hypothetical protein MUO27_07470 [Sedimentisphaerales bacterium]|nr:hypothetical protein [Sedimentisphaerales bacterium]
MSETESQEIISSDTEQHGESGKLVPVAESIRYRRRAQSAEKQLEDLSRQLAEADSQAARMSEQLNEIRLEQNLTRKLAAADAVDLEAAVLIAKTRLQADDGTSADGVIEQLKTEKPYLFRSSNSDAPTIKKTAGVRERIQSSHAILEKAAKKAASTGSRRDLQEYLKLRRNYL